MAMGMQKIYRARGPDWRSPSTVLRPMWYPRLTADPEHNVRPVSLSPRGWKWKSSDTCEREVFQCELRAMGNGDALSA